MEVITQSAQATQNLGAQIANNLTSAHQIGQGASIVALYGELGSGKTTFVQGLAKTLGLPNRIVSPTFIIVREYGIKRPPFDAFYHIDLYRLADAAEIDSLGLPDIFSDAGALVVIEWAEKLGIYLPSRRLDIKFKVVKSARKISILDKKS